jgi:pimeloyl-ACP methyl ester carboxylesterase
MAPDRAPESRVLDLDGPVHVLDFGGVGSPIVFLHGATSCAASWFGIATHLAGAHRVVAPDLLGHGRTPLARRKATLRADQRLFEGVVDGFGLREVSVVSITRGGLVAALEAALHPERIKRLVLLEPIAFPRLAGVLVALTVSPRLGNTILRRLAPRPEVGVRRWLKSTCAHPENVGVEQVEALVASMAVQLAEPQPFRGWVEAFRDLGLLILRGRIPAVYSAIVQPVLAIAGRDTTSASIPAIESLARRHRSWQLDILEGVGHPALEAPEVTANRIAAWLEAPETSSRGQATRGEAG